MSDTYCNLEYREGFCQGKLSRCGSLETNEKEGQINYIVMRDKMGFTFYFLLLNKPYFITITRCYQYA